MGTLFLLLSRCLRNFDLLVCSGSVHLQGSLGSDLANACSKHLQPEVDGVGPLLSPILATQVNSLVEQGSIPRPVVC